MSNTRGQLISAEIFFILLLIVLARVASDLARTQSNWEGFVEVLGFLDFLLIIGVLRDIVKAYRKGGAYDTKVR